MNEYGFMRSEDQLIAAGYFDGWDFDPWGQGPVFRVAEEEDEDLQAALSISISSRPNQEAEEEDEELQAALWASSQR